MTACERPGCTAPATARSRRPGGGFCSRRCSNLHLGWERGPAFYRALAVKSWATKRQRGRATVLRPHERRLMACGRFDEAAWFIYDRAYGAGWAAKHAGHRQLPVKRAS